MKEINKLKSQNLKMDEVIFETKKIVKKLEKRSINLNAEIENKKFIFAWTPIYIFKDGKNYRDLLSKIKV